MQNFGKFIGKTAKRQYRDGTRSENEGKGGSRNVEIEIGLTSTIPSVQRVSCCGGAVTMGSKY
jgi:hypothetical protein